jgi:hypothetical protein
MVRRTPRAAEARPSSLFVGGRGHGIVHQASGRRGRGNVQQNDTTDKIKTGTNNENDLTSSTKNNAAANMRAFGLSCVGFPATRQNVRETLNESRFRSHYGVGSRAVAAMFDDLKKSHPTINKTDFLMAMYWLNLYPTEHCLAGRWDYIEETCRNKVKKYTKMISKLANEKVSFYTDGYLIYCFASFANCQYFCLFQIKWLNFEEHDEVYICSVDGVHFGIQEPRKDPGAKWYDHKSNSAGLAYEIALAVRHNNIVWMRGPFPASTHDLTIFRGGKKDDPKDPSALQFKVPPGKRVVADSAYRSEVGIVATTKEKHPPEVKREFARIKSRQETFNSRIKSFRILSMPFRHNLDATDEDNEENRSLGFHRQVFESVCVAVQYDMENGHPLFEI